MKNIERQHNPNNLGPLAFQFKEYSDGELILFVKKALRIKKMQEMGAPAGIPGLAGKYMHFLASL